MRITYRHAVLACYVAGLLTLTLAPLPQTAYRLASAQGFDKAVHTTLFGGFAAVLYWSRLPGTAPGLWGVVGASAGLAALVELLQAPLPYRTADVWDFVWGVVGALVAYLVVRRVLPGGENPLRR
jgi:VanZ family protein